MYLENTKLVIVGNATNNFTIGETVSVIRYDERHDLYEVKNDKLQQFVVPADLAEIQPEPQPDKTKKGKDSVSE